MKKLIIKSGVFLFIMIAPVLYMNHLYKNTNYFMQLNGLGKFRKIGHNIEILNLGNSHEERGIIYENNINRKGYNLALSSQPFEYDYYILDSYSQYLKEGAVVIIPLSYFDWYYKYEEIFMGNISVYNERYYSILDRDHILNYEIKKDILYNRIPILTAGKNMKYILKDIPWEGRKENNSVVKDIDKVASYKYKSWVEDVMVSDPGQREKTKAKNEKYLKKIIELCYLKKFVPVLVTLPMTDSLIDLFSEEFQLDFQGNCNKILEEYPGLQYFDYSKDEKFSKNVQFFEDSDHLNTYGANEFSKQFFSDLEEYGILDDI